MKKTQNILITIGILLTGGCTTQSLLPTKGVYTESAFQTYMQVEDLVDGIVPGETKYEYLVSMGLDLENMPNVQFF